MIREQLSGASIGYMKPVGHKWILQDDVKVDKDVPVFRERFGLTDAWRHMSPVVLADNYVRRSLDGTIDAADELARVRSSFEALLESHDFVLVEGTGHAGVGSVVQMDNPTVARALDLDVVIVTGGGIGSSFDEIALNTALCRARDVRVRGSVHCP